MRFNLLIISILLIGCDTIIKRDIQSFLNKNINISTNMFSSELLFCHKNKKIINDKTLRIIVYHDSTQCSPCALKNIYKWHDYMDNLDSLYGFTDINFIFSPPRNQVQELKLNLKTNLFEYPIFIDTLNQFNKNNPHLPKDSRFHTFLLDENNNVILVGNPLHNKKIAEMYDRVIKEKIGI